MTFDQILKADSLQIKLNFELVLDLIREAGARHNDEPRLLLLTFYSFDGD